MILDYESAQRTEFMRREVRGFGERDRLEPELRERAVAAHVNVRGLVVFVTEEEEAVRAYAKNCRHSQLTISSSAASVARWNEKAGLPAQSENPLQGHFGLEAQKGDRP